MTHEHNRKSIIARYIVNPMDISKKCYVVILINNLDERCNIANNYCQSSKGIQKTSGSKK